MSLETGTTIAQLQSANPTSGDPRNQGDDHLRLIKSVLKAQFPGVAGQGYAIPITTSEAELNYSTGVTSALQTQLNALSAAIAAIVVIPSGLIAQWKGTIATIPTGWVLCNGANGTPNLTDKFIVAAGGTYNPADVGGSNDAVIVSHNHTANSVSTSGSTFTGNAVGDHSHSYHGPDGPTLGTGAGGYANTAPTILNTVAAGGFTPSGGVTTNTTTTTTNTATGVSATGANRPPYFALAYIMKT
jgi:hypothetical protein